jgi:hypothetical protein
MNYREFFEAMLAGHIVQKDYSDGCAYQTRMDAKGNWMQRYRSSCDGPWSAWGLVRLIGAHTGPNARVIKRRTRDDVACEPVVGDVAGARTVNAVTPEGVTYRYRTVRVDSVDGASWHEYVHSVERAMWREYVRSVDGATITPVQEGGDAS